MKRKTLIDGNSIGFAAHHGAKLSAGEQATQAIFGSINTVRSIVHRRSDARTIVLWDGRSWRKDASKEYKAQRDQTAAQRKDREEYKAQSKHVRRALTALGIGQVIASNLEADDLAGILSQRFEAQGAVTRLVTRDKDWLQLVTDKVLWEDHKTGDIVSSRSFEQVTGCRNSGEFVQQKALTGDVSDNIKGVGGIGDKKAAELLRIWGSVEAFLSDENREARWCSETGVKTCPKAVREFPKDEVRLEKFRENMRLMDLRSDLPEPVNLQVTPGNFDPEAFKKICLEFGFHSILDDFDRFIQPFK